MKNLFTVLSKEIQDNLRDRRSLSSSIVTPLFTPLLLIALMVVLGQTLFQDPQENALILPVAGAERAPALMDYLIQNNVVVTEAPANPQAAVREGDVDVVLIIPEDYPETIESGEPARLQLVMDTSRSSSLNSIERTRELVQRYSSVIGVLRLQARGIDPRVINALMIEPADVATPQSQTLLFLNMMPFLMIMTIFVGGMYVVIDATAGERERGSLEPLLINPVPRWQLVVAKLLASIPFAIATTVLSLVAFWLAFNLEAIEDLVGMPLTLDPGTLLAIFWLTLPMVLLASALQILVANYTRSFKEAQTYLSFLPLVAGFPSAFLMFLPVRTTTTTMMIPIFSQSLLINKFLRLETVQAEHILISTLVTVLASVVVIYLAIRLYEREQVLVGR